MSVTIFHKIISKEIPAHIIFEDEDVCAFYDINPQAPIHILVVPKIPMKGLDDIATQDSAFLGRFLQKIAYIASQEGLDAGYRVVFNTGHDSGQEIDYLHAHILGGRVLQWPPG